MEQLYFFYLLKRSNWNDDSTHLKFIYPDVYRPTSLAWNAPLECVRWRSKLTFFYFHSNFKSACFQVVYYTVHRSFSIRCSATDAPSFRQVSWTCDRLRPFMQSPMRCSNKICWRPKVSTQLANLFGFYRQSEIDLTLPSKWCSLDTCCYYVKVHSLLEIQYDKKSPHLISYFSIWL